MANQVADGLHQMNLNSSNSTSRGPSYSAGLSPRLDQPHLSPFPKIARPSPDVPPSDEELEATLESARAHVLSSNDPEMQLAWAADALIYVGACAEDEERMAAAKPHSARSGTPRIEHQLRVDAMNIVTFLAEQHHPKAEFLRGMWLEWGRFGQREDKKEAFRCYSRAADRGYARAEYRIGMLYESYNDPIKALQNYHRGVEAGDAASCYRLGMMTLRGQHGQPQDYGRGIDLIKRSAVAADENAAQGAYVYGMLLAKQLPQIEVPERFLRPDERQARMWIEKAAFLKFAKAQLKMGSAYELADLGCEFSPQLSMHYNALASKQGEAEADMALSKWFLVGAEGIFQKNEALAYTYAERAAAGGLATADFALGYFHEIGVSVPVNLAKATEWYQKASAHDNEDARGRLEALSKKQVLNKTDHEKVAVKRITSMYGSVRDERPQRFEPQQPSGRGPGPNGSNPPDRGTTPYPLHNGPPAVAALQPRPASAAPYPVNDGPPPMQRPAPAGGFFDPHASSQYPQQRPATTLNPEIRPSSAFAVVQDHRPMSLPVAPPQNANGYNIYSPAGSHPNQNLPPQQQQFPPSRSTPLPQQPFPQNPNNFDPRSRPNPTSHNSATRILSQPQQQKQQPNSRLNIGYSAPPDDRRQRTPQPSANSRLPSGNSMPNFDAHKQANKPLPPAANGAGAGATAGKPKPPSKDSAPQRPATAAAAQQPPKKGPKTFEEMGVPSTKQENECVVM